MRFEAKHQWFKKLAHNLGNFVNVAKTLAWRHQRLSCYDLMGPVLKRTTQIKKGATHTHTHTHAHAHTHLRVQAADFPEVLQSRKDPSAACLQITYAASTSCGCLSPGMA